MKVKEAYVEFQKLLMDGHGECELVGKYDSFVQDIEGFDIREMVTESDGHKRMIPRDEEGLELEAKRVVRIQTGTYYNPMAR